MQNKSTEATEREKQEKGRNAIGWEIVHGSKYLLANIIS